MKKILIVEDESIIAEDIKKTITSFGYTDISVVYSGEEALGSLKRSLPDLVIMDIILDGKVSGVEVSQQIHDEFHIPVIFLTAHVDKKTMEQAKKTEPYGYLIKPFEDRELYAALETAFYKYEMEKKIYASEYKYRNLIKTMEEGLIIVDELENITFCNPASEKIFACPKKELQTKNIREFVSPEQFKKLLSNTRLRRQGISNSYKVDITAADGVRKTIKISASPMIERKKYKGTFGLLSDITEEEAAGRNVRILKKAIDTLQIGITVTDVNGRIIFTNPADAFLHGYIPQDLVGKDVRIFAPTEIRNPMNIEKVKQWKGLIRESTNIRKDDSIFPVRLISDIVRDDRGIPEAIITTCEDITEQKDAELALKESEERFRRTFFHAAAGMIIVLPNGKIKQANQSFCNMIGYSEKQVLSKTLRDLTHPEDIEKTLANIEKMLNGVMEYSHQEERIIHKSGELIWVNVSMSSVSDVIGKSVYLIVQVLDISEMRKAEEAMKEINRKLEKRVEIEVEKRMKQQQLLIQKSKLESLGKLAAGIAHEINQPLSGISMALDNILFKLTTAKFSEDYLKGKLESIFEDIDRIRHIINHVRIFSRDQKTVKFDKVDINRTIEDALSMVKAQYNEHDIRLILNLTENIGFLIGNKYKLEQVILNLLNNAKDAIEAQEKISGELSYKKRIKISTFTTKNKIILEIEDNGIGIPHSMIDNIFDPFFTTKDPEKGTGLGLSIVYGIVKEFKGEITVLSEENKFTRFRIEIHKIAENRDSKED